MWGTGDITNMKGLSALLVVVTPTTLSWNHTEHGCVFAPSKSELRLNAAAEGYIRTGRRAQKPARARLP